MLNRVIAFSLKNRWLVLLAALAVVRRRRCTSSRRTPVDVFPDLNRPTVTVMTEAPGLAPEEVEVLVTRPLEYQLNGATGVQRVRSASGIGLSVVWVEFDWGTDIYRDRQIVAEKLQLARERLPAGRQPGDGPDLVHHGRGHDPGPAPDRRRRRPRRSGSSRAMELRTLGEFTVRNRLLAVEGVSQVTVMGGVLKQYQVVTSPERLAAQDVTLQQLTDAAEKANVLAGGGVMVRDAEGVADPHQRPEPDAGGDRRDAGRRGAATAAGADQGRGRRAVRRPGPPRRRQRRGCGRADEVVGGPAVILAVQKQPDANTLDLTPQHRRGAGRAPARLPRRRA